MAKHKEASVYLGKPLIKKNATFLFVAKLDYLHVSKRLSQTIKTVKATKTVDCKIS